MKKPIAILLALLMLLGLAACGEGEPSGEPTEKTLTARVIKHSASEISTVEEITADGVYAPIYHLRIPKPAQVWDVVEITYSGSCSTGFFDEVIAVEIIDKYDPAAPPVSIAAGGAAITPWLDVSQSRRWDPENGYQQLYDHVFKPLSQIASENEFPELTYADDLALELRNDVEHASLTAVYGEDFELVRTLADQSELASLEQGRYYVELDCVIVDEYIEGKAFDRLNGDGYFVLIVE